MDKFLVCCDVPKLIKEVENLNSLITIAEIFPQGLDGFMGESNQSFMKQIVLFFCKLGKFLFFQKTEKENTS